jgi:hypothetical protein
MRLSLEYVVNAGSMEAVSNSIEVENGLSSAMVLFDAISLLEGGVEPKYSSKKAVIEDEAGEGTSLLITLCFNRASALSSSVTLPPAIVMCVKLPILANKSLSLLVSLVVELSEDEREGATDSAALATPVRWNKTISVDRSNMSFRNNEIYLSSLYT